MKYTSFYFFPALFLLILFSCKKDELINADIISGETEFAIPLGKATTTVEGLLENFDEYTDIEIGPDNVIHLIYRGDVLTQFATPFFQEAAETVPAAIPMVDTNFFILPFSSPEVLEVDKAFYKTGRVGIAVESTEYEGPVKLTVTLNEVYGPNGGSLTFDTIFQSPITGLIDGIGIEIEGLTKDVSGYELIPNADGQVTVEYTAVTEGGMGDTIILDIVSLLNADIYFRYFEGYLGNQVYSGGRDTIEIDFFESWTQGDVFFENPTIKINLQNSFGVPTRSVIDTFDILTADGQRIPLRSEFIDTVSGIDFPYPLTPGHVETLTFVFDTTNSNIDSVLGSRPIALDYKVDARMNPDTNVTLRGFISDESFYNIQVEVDLPLHGKASGFGIEDEFNVDLSDYDEVLEAEFKLVADNETPLHIDGQAYFVDENGAVLDSLFDMGTSTIVEGASVDGDGNVMATSTEISYATFSAARFKGVRSAKKILIKAFFSTSNNGQQVVRAEAGQEAEIRMGLKLKME